MEERSSNTPNSSKLVKIHLKTLTPLWTGDAWGENNTIRPSSLMGSFRFWFEVICYFSGVTKESDYGDGKLKDELKEKVSNKKVSDLFVKNGNDFSGVDKTLAEMGISLPSRIFGCTGWKGWVRIKEVRPIEDFCFGNKLNLPYAITISKNASFLVNEYKDKKELNDFINSEYFGKWKEKNKKFRGDYSVWYFAQPYFYGKFELISEVEEKILEPFFYPLLTFMEKYGFWGGKWNIGYGRLNIEKVELKNDNDFEEINNWRKEEFVFSEFFEDKDSRFKDKKFSDFVQFASDFTNLENKINKILYKLENQITNNGFYPIIKELIKIKAQERLNHRTHVKNNDLRHRLFGSVKYPPDKKELPQGTKIIPWIYEENGQLKGGFISISGILNLR